MNLFGLMDVSGSALKAERVRAEVVASNMANSETTRTADGGPYRRHHVIFSANDAQSSFSSMLLSSGSGSASASPGVGFLPGSNFSQGASLGGADQMAGGVSIGGVIEDQSSPLLRFDPGHPDANANGFVAYPDINPLTEMVDLMGATRSYGMNASAVQAEKGMLAASLDILK